MLYYFHLWVYFAPTSYEWAMRLFIAGLSLHITEMDTNFSHIVLGTIAVEIQNNNSSSLFVIPSSTSADEMNLVIDSYIILNY